MIEVIPFTTTHQKEVNALLAAIESEFDQPITSPGARPNHARKLDKYWIATSNGQLAGTIGVLRLQDGNAVLKSMFVDHEFRGIEKGISNLLLQTAFKWCNESEVSGIFLGTMTQFRAAHRFYEKNGFRRIGESELPPDFVRNPIDDVFYVKNTSPKKTVRVAVTFRNGNLSDLDQLVRLANKAWRGYRKVLAPEHWSQLNRTLNNPDVFTRLLAKAHCVVCESEEQQIVGMAFLVSNGNPDEIYEPQWSHLRFVSVDPDFGGQGICKMLTKKCISIAKETGEKTVALHTSEIMGKAMGIYQSLGFEVLRELKRSLGKRYWLFLLKL